MSKGFTLVELLIVIGIIGIIMAGVMITINPAMRMDDAKKKVRDDASSKIIRAIETARIEQMKVMGTANGITGSGCSDCSCRTETDLSNPSQTCLNRMNASWQAIAGKDIPLDPWGNVWLFDENEGEGSPPGCSYDILRSAGSDHLFNTTDDKTYNVPHFICP